MWVQVGARGGPIMRQDPRLPLCFSVGVDLRWYLRWFWRSHHLTLVNLRFQYLELSTHIQEGLPQNLTFICLFVCLFVCFFVCYCAYEHTYQKVPFWSNSRAHHLWREYIKSNINSVPYIFSVMYKYVIATSNATSSF